MKPLWAIELAQSLRGSMPPVFDPLTDSVYLSDGWGTSFASLSLRRFSLEDGAQTAALRLRAPVFSVCFASEKGSVLVATGKRLVEIDRRTWAEVARWESGVPKYSHYSAIVGRHVLLMGWAGPTLSIFDLVEGSCTRRRIGSCQGMFPRSDGSVLVCSGKQGVVSTCIPGASSVQEFVKTESFLGAVHCRAGDVLILAIGVPFEITETSATSFRVSDRLKILQLEEPAVGLDVRAPTAFDAFWANADARRFFFGRGNLLRVYGFDGRELTLESERTLPNALEPFLIVPERSIVLGADTRSDKGRIEAWRL